MLSACLRIYDAQRHLEDVDLDATARVIGRGRGCAVVLDDPAVSRQHARIVALDEGFELEDLGSPNPTLVNGAPVTRHRLAHGDRVGLGRHTLIFQAASSLALPQPEDSVGMHIAWTSQEATSYLAPGARRGLHEHVARPVVEALDGAHPRQVTFKKPALLIGRGPNADLDARSWVPFVEDLALLTRSGDICELSRLAPLVHISVNGAGCRRAILQDGDHFEVGRSRFVIRIPARPQLADAAQDDVFTIRG